MCWCHRCNILSHLHDVPAPNKCICKHLSPSCTLLSWTVHTEWWTTQCWGVHKWEVYFVYALRCTGKCWHIKTLHRRSHTLNCDLPQNCHWSHSRLQWWLHTRPGLENVRTSLMGTWKSLYPPDNLSPSRFPHRLQLGLRRQTILERM